MKADVVVVLPEEVLSSSCGIKSDHIARRLRSSSRRGLESPAQRQQQPPQGLPANRRTEVIFYGYLFLSGNTKIAREISNTLVSGLSEEAIFNDPVFGI